MRNLIFVAGITGLIAVWQPAYSGSGHGYKHGKSDTAHDDHSGHDHKKKKKKHNDHKGHDNHENHDHDDDHKHPAKKKDDHDHRAHSTEGDHEEHADSHGHDHEGKAEKFGKGKAITAVKNEGESFALSSKAVGTLGIQFGNITQRSGKFIIPPSALVEYQNNTGVYVKTKEWFKLVSIKVLKEESGYIVVTSDSLKPDDEIVISQTGLVRVAHLEASGQGGQGHAH